MSDGQRATLTIKTPSRGDLAAADWEKLLQDESFLRTLFTIFTYAGIFTGNFQPDQRTHAFLEGRRSLGLDILRTAEKYLGPDALMRILSAEGKTPKEAPNATRRSGYAEHRSDELGSDDGSDAERSELRYLDYSG